MTETKPAIQSWTLWINAVLPLLYLLVPQAREVITPEWAISTLAVVNGIIRIFKTDKGIEGAV